MNLDIKKLSDEEIFQRLEENENLFFGEIIDRYEEKLLKYISRISNFSQDENQDLLQEIFLRVYKNANSFDSGDKFSPWIYRIAHNVVIDYWRKHKKDKEQISIDEHFNFVESIFNKNEVEEEIYFKENQELLEKLYSKLPLKYREVAVLRFEEEKSYDEISEILKIPKSSVGTLISRAKKILKKEFELIKKNYNN